MLLIKILVSFTQINLALPTMMKGYSWSFPIEYTEWLKQISIFELNLLPLLGIQCVMDMDYRYSVLVAIALPTTVCLLAFLGLRVSASRASRQTNTAKSTSEVRRDTLGMLFDLSDFDNSGELDVSETHHFIKVVMGGGGITPSKSKTRELILGSGGRRLPHNNSDAVISREAFLRATAKESSDQNTLAFFFVTRKSLKYLRKQQAISTWVSGGAQTLLMFHAPVSMRAFLYFDCVKLGKHHFLRADYSIECFEQEWNAFLPLALILLITFALGIPLVLGGYMLYHRRALRSPAMRRFLGFIMARYRPGVEWWEIQELLRKMVLTGMLIYLPVKTRTAIAVAICITSLSMLNYFRSHASSMVFWMCQVSYLLTTSKFLVATFGQTITAEDSSYDDRFLGIILVSTDIVMYVTGLLCCLYISYKVVCNKGAPVKRGTGLEDQPPRPPSSLSRSASVHGAIQKRFSAARLRKSVIALRDEIAVGQTEKRADEAARSMHDKILQRRNSAKTRLDSRLKMRMTNHLTTKMPMRVVPATRATTGPAAAAPVLPALVRPAGSKTGDTAAAKMQGVVLPVRETKRPVPVREAKGPAAAAPVTPGLVRPAASKTGETAAAKTQRVAPPVRATKKPVAATLMVPGSDWPAASKSQVNKIVPVRMIPGAESVNRPAVQASKARAETKANGHFASGRKLTTSEAVGAVGPSKKKGHSEEDMILATKISAMMHPKLRLCYMGGGEGALLKVYKSLGKRKYVLGKGDLGDKQLRQLIIRMAVKPELLSNKKKNQSAVKMSKKTVAALRHVMLKDAGVEEKKGVKITFAVFKKYANPRVTTAKD
jgi:hypothetical protein